MAPETTADYVEPSLLFLTNYYQDPMGTPPLLLGRQASLAWPRNADMAGLT
jgi:hypothetical protein